MKKRGFPWVVLVVPSFSFFNYLFIFGTGIICFITKGDYYHHFALMETCINLETFLHGAGLRD